MTFKIIIFSQEKEDFVLEITASSDTKFYQLHQLILSTCQYAEGEQRFLICDEDWHVKNRICLSDNEDADTEEDIYVMDSCTLGDFLEEEGQHLAYVFDPEGKRYLLMEVDEVTFGNRGAGAKATRKRGLPPMQSLTSEDEMQKTTTDSEFDEEFYGEDDFEEGELDMDGFEINE